MMGDRNVLETVVLEGFEPYRAAPVAQEEELCEYPEMQEGANGDADSDEVRSDAGSPVTVGPIDMTNRANFPPGLGPGSLLTDMKKLCTQWSLPSWGTKV